MKFKAAFGPFEDEWRAKAKLDGENDALLMDNQEQYWVGSWIE